ncbi:MAG: SMP-30/gluconolactonase/LRE family protein [Verrucomicrobiota bacterium]
MSQLNRFNEPIRCLGQDLVRPECVLANERGEIFVSDFRGGVSVIKPDGTQQFYGGCCEEVGVLQTNGFALLKDGSFLIAHLGQEQGGVFRLTRDNEISPFLLEVDGIALPPTNFVYLDYLGRIWITVSTCVQPRAYAYRSNVSNGFIVLVDKKGPRIVADNIGYTNECWVNPEGTELYVNATFGRQLVRYHLDADGNASAPEVIAAFGAGTYPDGLTGDTEGNLWVTSIISNRVIKVAPDGSQTIMLEEFDSDHLETAEDAYLEHRMGRPHLDNNPASLKNISSLAFSGTDLSMITLGCLLDNQVYQIQSQATGLKPAHWHF